MCTWERRRDKGEGWEITRLMVGTTNGVSFLFLGQRWESQECVDVNNRMRRCVWVQAWRVGAGRDSRKAEGTTFCQLPHWCLSTSWIMRLLWGAVRDCVFKFSSSSPCAHNSLEIRLLDAGTEIHPMLSVSQPLSHREEKIPPYSSVKPHEKQAQPLDCLPVSSQDRKWEEKTDRDCVGMGG